MIIIQYWESLSLDTASERTNSLAPIFPWARDCDCESITQHSRTTWDANRSGNLCSSFNCNQRLSLQLDDLDPQFSLDSTPKQLLWSDGNLHSRMEVASRSFGRLAFRRAPRARGAKQKENKEAEKKRLFDPLLWSPGWIITRLIVIASRFVEWWMRIVPELNRALGWSDGLVNQGSWPLERRYRVAWESARSPINQKKNQTSAPSIVSDHFVFCRDRAHDAIN